MVSSDGLIFAYFILENWSLTLAYSVQSFLHKMLSPFYYKMSVFQQTIILYQKMHTVYFLPVFLSIWLTFFFIADDADVMFLPAPVMIEKCYIKFSNQSSIKDLKTWGLFFPNEANILFFQKKAILMANNAGQNVWKRDSIWNSSAGKQQCLFTIFVIIFKKFKDWTMGYNSMQFWDFSAVLSHLITHRHNFFY